MAPASAKANGEAFGAAETAAMEATTGIKNLVNILKRM